MKKLFLTLAIISLLFSCDQKEKINSKIEAYLNEALDSIQKNALNSSKVNWKVVKKIVFEKARSAKNTEETYPTIAYILEKLNDHHSFLQKNGENLNFSSQEGDKDPYPYNKRIRVKSGMHTQNGKRIARVYIPSGGNQKGYAQHFQDKIAELASQKPSGWIVDLRGNGGGNMWPMLAGIGRLVGENPLGGSVNGEGGRDYYKYKEGESIYIDFDGKEYSRAKAEEKPFDLPKYQPLAFLIDRGTGSSGEALAVILKGRKNTRGFGEKTYGATTSTRGFKLSDSLNLVLAVSTFQDRKENVYFDGIEPDVTIVTNDEFFEPSKDPVVKAAISWILEETKFRNL